MKSISLAAATAILAATSAQAVLNLGFFGTTICVGGASDTEVIREELVGNDFDKGFCLPLITHLGTEYFGAKIVDCDHNQCECALYSDPNCQDELAIINYDQRKAPSDQFCFTQAHSVEAYKCWYPPNV